MLEFTEVFFGTELLISSVCFEKGDGYISHLFSDSGRYGRKGTFLQFGANLAVCPLSWPIIKRRLFVFLVSNTPMDYG